MMSTSSRVALATMMITGLVITGCAKQLTTRPQASTMTRSPTAVPVTSSNHREHSTAGASNTSKASDARLPDQTGIAACDDYLSSYMACHRAAGIFAPDQLQGRYEAMRTNLLRDSQNPDIRPQLAERCNSLSRSLRQALHGKSCATNPAPSSSSP